MLKPVTGSDVLNNYIVEFENMLLESKLSTILTQMLTRQQKIQTTYYSLLKTYDS